MIRSEKMRIAHPPTPHRRVLVDLSEGLTRACNLAVLEAHRPDATVHPRTQAYRLGVAEVGGSFGGITRDTVNATVQAHLSKTRVNQVLRGERQMAGFRTVPLVFRAENLIAEDGRLFARVSAGKAKMFETFRIEITPYRDKRDRSSMLASIAREGRYRDAKIWLDRDRHQWMASVSYEVEPRDALGHLVAGLDIGHRTAFAVAVILPDGKARTWLEHHDRGVEARAWKYRQLRRRGSRHDKWGRYRDQAFDQICARLAEKLRSQGVGTVHIEDLGGLAKVWGRREAAAFLPGDMYGTPAAPGRLVQRLEREGIVVRRVRAAFTSQTCSKCGSVEHKDPYGRRGESFWCACGHRMNADKNAAINIAMADAGETTRPAARGDSGRSGLMGESIGALDSAGDVPPGPRSRGTQRERCGARHKPGTARIARPAGDHSRSAAAIAAPTGVTDQKSRNDEGPLENSTKTVVRSVI